MPRKIGGNISESVGNKSYILHKPKSFIKLVAFDFLALNKIRQQDDPTGTLENFELRVCCVSEARVKSHLRKRSPYFGYNHFIYSVPSLVA